MWENGCFVSVNSLTVPALLKEGNRRGGGGGGGAAAGENVASSNEKFPFSSQPRPAAAHHRSHACCMLRYVCISNLRRHMEMELVTLSGLVAQLFAQDS